MTKKFTQKEALNNFGEMKNLAIESIMEYMNATGDNLTPVGQGIIDRLYKIIDLCDANIDDLMKNPLPPK